MNVNEATKEELKSLPGVGEKTAEKIIAARPIASLEEFERVVPPAAAVAIEQAGVLFEWSLPHDHSSLVEGGSVEEAFAEQVGVDIIANQKKRQAIENALTIGMPAVAAFKQVDKLANYLLKRWAHEGPGNPDLPPSEWATEQAVRLLERFHPDNQPQGVDGMQLRRIKPPDTRYFESKFGTGTRFLCVWNMKWGASLEAFSPQDPPVQKEIGEWFRKKGIEVVFAHYGPSIRVKTRARGFVPVALFEIIEEKEEKGADQQSDQGQPGDE